MKETRESSDKCWLRYYFISTWCIVVIAVAGVVFFSLIARMRLLLYDTEVEKLRPAAREVAHVCADYSMSPSEELLRTKFAKIVQEFPDLSYVLFKDGNQKIHWHAESQKLDPLKKQVAQLDPRTAPVNTLKINGKVFVDIGTVTNTLPRLPVHVGFSKSLLRHRLLGLLWNQGGIVLLAVGGGLGAAFLLTFWLTRPLIRATSLVERLSLGDMSVKLDLKYRGEIGRVCRSLGRLKESVLYALRRLESPVDPSKGQGDPTEF